MPKIGNRSLTNREEFSIGVYATLINSTLLYRTFRAYFTIDYNAYILSKSTILNRGATIHLVNSATLLKGYTLVKGLYIVEVGT